MTFDNHVFISYSHPDNLSRTGKGFVTQLEEALAPYLSNRLKRMPPKIWRDDRLSDHGDFDADIIKNLKGSAVMLSVLTDNYVGSEWCRREAATFCEAAQAGAGLSVNEKPRLFKVVMLPLETQDGLPDPLRKPLGTEFFARVGKDRRISGDKGDLPVPLDPIYGPEFAAQFDMAVTLLAAEIAESIKALNRSELGAASQGPKKACVYLAQCDEDRRADREALRSELLQYGHPVLPDCELPGTEAELRQVVSEMLSRSSLSIHLLGSGPGKVPSGAGLDSELVIQNELAVQRAQVAPLRRLVWLPRGTTCARPSHQEFLNRVLDDPAVLGKASLVDGDRSKLMEEMHAALKLVESDAAEAAAQAALEAQMRQAAAAQARPAAADVAASGGRLKLYVQHTLDDLEASGDLRDALEERFDLLTPVFEGTAEEVRTANMSRLKACDAVLLYWGAGTDAWLASQQSEVEKSRAERAGRPFKAVLECVASPSTRQKADRVRKPRPQVVNALQVDSAQVLPAIEAALGVTPHG